MKVFIKKVEEYNNIFPIKINSNDIIKKTYSQYSKNKFLRSQYFLERQLDIMFHNYYDITDNVDEAEIIFIPLYLLLIGFKVEFVFEMKIILNILNKFKKFFEENKNKKILLCYSDVMWEHEYCFINNIDLPKNVFILCYEKVKDKFSNNQISLPYITHIKCDSNNYKIFHKENKKYLISYAGRKRKEMNYFKNIEIYDTDIYQKIKHQWITCNNKSMYHKIDTLYENSYYSLQPHGDKETRKGFYHSLLLGCIPVIFENNYKTYQDVFKKYVKLDDICIIIKQKNNIENILNFKKKHLGIMIDNINKIKHLLLYNDKNDEFIDYILEQVK